MQEHLSTITICSCLCTPRALMLSTQPSTIITTLVTIVEGCVECTRSRGTQRLEWTDDIKG